MIPKTIRKLVYKRTRLIAQLWQNGVNHAKIRRQIEMLNQRIEKGIAR